MFTGIITEVGHVRDVTRAGGSLQLTIIAQRSVQELNINDSVAVDGVCQTVIATAQDAFVVEAVEETLLKTTLGDLTVGSKVNLEMPMKLSDRIGGHLVQGHVDGVGLVKSILRRESSWLVTVEVPVEFTRYVIPVGSIAIQGVSLTIARVLDNEVTVSIIPHTMEKTNFSQLRVGSKVNLEFDLIGKYVERFMQANPKERALTAEKLRQWGYEA